MEVSRVGQSTSEFRVGSRESKRRRAHKERRKSWYLVLSRTHETLSVSMTQVNSFTIVWSHLFIAITPRSTLIWSGSTCLVLRWLTAVWNAAVRNKLFSSEMSCFVIIIIISSSTDIPDPLSPLLPIVHRFRQVLWATPRILTELLYVGSTWSSRFCSAMCRVS